MPGLAPGKKRLLITLSESTVAILEKLAEANQRFKSQEIEYLILREAANVNGTIQQPEAETT